MSSLVASFGPYGWRLRLGSPTRDLSITSAQFERFTQVLTEGGSLIVYYVRDRVTGDLVPYPNEEVDDVRRQYVLLWAHKTVPDGVLTIAWDLTNEQVPVDTWTFTPVECAALAEHLRAAQKGGG